MSAVVFVLLTLSTGNQVGYSCNNINRIEHPPGSPWTQVYVLNSSGNGNTINVTDTPQSIIERCNKR